MVSRKEWDRLADAFEAEVCDITRETRGDQIGRLVRSLAFDPGKSVLVDLGCGLGTFVGRYGKHFRESYAVEHAPRIIARAKARFKGARGITWMTSNIPPAVRRIGRRSDLTVCMNVITMPQARVRERMWAGLADVTKKKGHALIVVPSIESDRMVERVAYGTPTSEAIAETPDGLVDRGGSRQKHFAREELRAVLARHGFRAKKMQRVFYPWQKEGLRKPRNAGRRQPWDWLVLAERL
ncbi:MAG TPA: class I SAM-dependent methyltransferase [Rhizomicrobium sp.]|nr:class I SAM-dependent methyltransferase [Rhizomicrobium sp.]